MKRKVLRPHIIFRMALILFMLVILFTAIVSGLYARFVSQKDNDSPTASATAWGFNVDFDGSKMFSKYYQGGVSAEAGLENDDYAVRAQAEGTVVTPDTSGKMVLTITGSSEVKAKVTMSASGSDVKLSYSSVEYLPIKWTLTVSDNGVETKLLNRGSFQQIISTLNSYEHTISAATETNLIYTISWEWPYENGSTDGEKALYNELDTVFAAYSAGKPIDAKYTVDPELDFSFSVTVEQAS